MTGQSDRHKLRRTGVTATLDKRTLHLVALVKDGATLEEAGRVYGIGRERVRQILKAEGLNTKELPGRSDNWRGRRPVRPAPAVKAAWEELPVGLAPVIEAMRRAGMLYHEIADVFEISCEDVHRLVCERVPASERSALAATVLRDGRSARERALRGVRGAAGVMERDGEIGGDQRRHAEAMIDRWLAVHPELAGDVSSPPDPTEAALPCGRAGQPDLRGELQRFKAELRAGGLRESTIHSYLMGSSLFVRWLTGDYVPGTGRAEPAGGGGAEVPA